MLRMLTNVFVALLTLFSPYALSVTVENLFEVQLPYSASGAEKDALFEQALKTVVVRLTEREDLLENKRLQPAFKSSEKYVQKYSFEEDHFWAQVDPKRVAELLDELAVPYLAENRPVALAWIAIESNSGQRYVIGADSAQTLELIDTLNNDLALAVTLPLMDLEDVSQVSVTDLHPNFAGRLAAASARYAADVWLAVKLVEQVDDKGWLMEWMAQTPTQSRIFKPALDQTPEALITQAIKALALIIVEDYGVATSKSSKSVSIEVSDVKSLSQYVGLLEYLEGLDVVTQAKVVGSSGDRLQIALKTIGGETALSQSVRLDHQLIAERPGSFRWTP